MEELSKEENQESEIQKEIMKIQRFILDLIKNLKKAL